MSVFGRHMKTRVVTVLYQFGRIPICSTMLQLESLPFFCGLLLKSETPPRSSMQDMNADVPVRS